MKFAASQSVASSRPRLLRLWTERPSGSHVRVEWEADGVTRTTMGRISDGFVRWDYETPPDDVDELAYIVGYDGGEHTYPGVEYAGEESRAEMDAAVSTTCFGCGARVASEDELSERGHCGRCFIAAQAVAL